tara:strand:- start:23 stop:760 length:738 start_codon:yes stop_codon:yes gene_type:complete
MIERPDYFPRILAKSAMGGSISTGERPTRFLLFESITDKNWSQNNFMKRWSKEIGFKRQETKAIEWVFAYNKDEAISCHKEAFDAGYRISTLVDMDSDTIGYKVKRVKKIHTTTPACTLWTMQFVDRNGNLIDDHLNAFIKSQLPSSDNSTISEIAKTTANLTMKRLLKGNRFAEQNFSNKGWMRPINDHSLCEAISGVLGEDKTKQVDLAIRASALEDKNGLIRDLFRKMFNDIFADDGPHSRT